jgi:type VI secretion system secreted protein VgrG
MRRRILILPAITLLAGFSLQSNASIMLNSAGNFALLAGSTVTNAGPSLVDGGDVAVSPGFAITGFLSVDGGPGIIAPPYTTFVGSNGIAIQAQKDLDNAYSAAAALPLTETLTNQDLGGLTLLPGVYFFASAAQLSGTLTLNDMGDPTAQFVFQIGSTLTTGSNSAVVTINGGATPGATVFWQVGSSATLGTNTAFEGHILAYSSISLDTGATILDGSALAQNGAVTLESNDVINAVAPIPEPALTTLAMGAALLLGARRKLRVEKDICEADRQGGAELIYCLKGLRKGMHISKQKAG